MISRPTLHGSDWWKFRFWNIVTRCIQSSFSIQICIKGAESARGAGHRGAGGTELRDAESTGTRGAEETGEQRGAESAVEQGVQSTGVQRVQGSGPQGLQRVQVVQRAQGCR